MKAYQYFHLPSGYLSKLSDNDTSLKSRSDAIRNALGDHSYISYFLDSDNNGYLFISSQDQLKNRLVKGRVFSIFELFYTPFVYVTAIYENTLMSESAPLMVRDKPIQELTPPAYRLSNLALAFAFSTFFKDENYVFSFMNETDAYLTLRLLTYLLPLEFARKVSFVAADFIPSQEVKVVDDFGETVLMKSQFVFLTRPISEEEKKEHKYIDFTCFSGEPSSLDAVSSLIANTNLAEQREIKVLKEKLSHFIDEDGVKSALLDISKYEKEMLQSKDGVSINKYFDCLASLDDESIRSNLDILISDVSKELEQGQSESLLAFIGELMQRHNYLKDALKNVSVSYFSKDVLTAPKELIVSDKAMVEQYIAAVKSLPINKDLVTHYRSLIEILFSDLSYWDDYHHELFALLDVSNSSEEKEKILFNIIIDESSQFDDDDYNYLALLCLSAYQSDKTSAHKVMRMSSFAKLLFNEEDPFKQIEILIEIKERITRINDLYNLGAVNLNSFFFDEELIINRSQLVDELNKYSYADILSFYDTHRNIAYKGLIDLFSEILADLDAFLEQYQYLYSEKEIERLSKIISSLPDSNAKAKIIKYLSEVNSEMDNNKRYAEIRLNHISRCISLLTESERAKVMIKPNASFEERIQFVERVGQLITSKDKPSSLMDDVEVTTSHLVDTSSKPQSQLLVHANNVNLIPVEVHIHYVKRLTEKFEVLIKLYADEQITVDELTLILHDRYDQYHDQDVVLTTFKDIKLKKKLFSRPVATISLMSPPLEDNVDIIPTIDPNKFEIKLIRQ